MSFLKKGPSGKSRLPFDVNQVKMACVGISLLTTLVGVYYMSILGLPLFVTAIPLAAALYVHLPLILRRSS